ncbi:hypothetical protein LOD99_5997 [Oopsacas minuta]|uniref:Uncharacterized protein n=1 Tax=Oopsacas minuta TaxID=111878 RepID=A0AAV7JPD3_9METZ|nr:hypothetical protein LOD99_5997 [Oopsacas minuta]
MASSLNFDDPYVASESFYQIWTDANHCLGMFERLEKNRTWSEWASDWTVGERNSINRKRMVFFLKKLIENVKSGQNTCEGVKQELTKQKGEPYNRREGTPGKKLECGRMINFGGMVGAGGTALATTLATGVTAVDLAAVSKGIIVLPAMTMSTVVVTCNRY